MKTIVVLDNMFAGDLLQDFTYLKENLNMEKYNLISPVMFMTKDNKYDTKDFTLKILASAISLGNMYNEFNTIESIVNKNKITIYFGPAHRNVKYQSVFVINPIALDAQEFLMDNYLKEANYRIDYIKSKEADKTFTNVKDLVVFLNDLQ
jgi:hypothetical protein